MSLDLVNRLNRHYADFTDPNQITQKGVLCADGVPGLEMEGGRRTRRRSRSRRHPKSRRHPRSRRHPKSRRHPRSRRHAKSRRHSKSRRPRRRQSRRHRQRGGERGVVVTQNTPGGTGFYTADFDTPNLTDFLGAPYLPPKWGSHGLCS